MNKNNVELLASYIDALYPIIYINHYDFKVVDDMISEIIDGRTILEYDSGIGVVDFESKSLQQESDLVRFLQVIKDEGYRKSMLLILKDVHKELEKPEVIALLKYIAERNLHNEEYNASVFIVSSKLYIPDELEELITVFDLPLPTVKEIKRILLDFANDLEIDVPKEVLGEMAVSFKGLNEFQITQILNLAYQDGGCLDFDDRQLVLRQKEQFIKKSGLLEIIPAEETVEDIGGLENLKKWLYKKEIVFNQLDKAMQFGVDIPKGILIVGMPGCGKSLAAKATASLFEIPLVRLDIGRLLGKYVGESEENLRKALKLSEAISPCVLWIDEIEKAFSGVGQPGGGSDVTTRLFGQFLTWMQEKENTVFIVATANDISKLPPEFLRKGRFDELFFVDFPNAEERKKIIEIHLKKRGQWKQGMNIIPLVKATEGYNGADLEAVVKEAIENCFITEKTELTIVDLWEAQRSIKSISKTLEKRIKEIREAVQDIDLKPASMEGDRSAVRLKSV
ncbi:MAG: AAA family ATPase [Lacrimispora saccharolytica]